MKKWIIIIIGYAVLVGLLLISLKDRNNYKDRYNVAVANNKAYDEQLSSAKNKNIALQLTTDQLNYAKDSILDKLKETKESLKIKNKNIKSIQYISTTLTRTDTITFSDTIFKETIKDRYLAVDTIVGDEWYSTNIKLLYPSTIVLKPKFNSEKHIIVSTKKETVNPPKKWWLLRLFQKKHRVLNVTVVENNPYVTNQESRYVEIIK